MKAATVCAISLSKRPPNHATRQPWKQTPLTSEEVVATVAAAKQVAEDVVVDVAVEEAGKEEETGAAAEEIMAQKTSGTAPKNGPT